MALQLNPSWEGMAHAALNHASTRGHADIDFDHLAITDQLRRTAGCEPIQFPFFIARLRKSLQLHFQRQAIQMDGAGRRLCDCHRHEHQTILDLCDQAQKPSRRPWSKTQSLMRGRLPTVVRRQILYMDQLAVLFINTSERASSR